MTTNSKAENAYLALFTLLQDIEGIQDCGRRLKEPSQVPFENTPALYINETGEIIEPTKGFEGTVASKQTLTCDLYLYVWNGVVEEPCTPQLNNMIQAVRDVLAPTFPGMYQELGGTVSHCWVSGKVEIIEGVLNGQGMAIIPVNILVNF